MIISALQKIGMYPIGKWPPPPFLPIVPVVDSRLTAMLNKEGGNLLPIHETALVQVYISRFNLSTYFTEQRNVLSWAPSTNWGL